MRNPQEKYNKEEGLKMKEIWNRLEEEAIKQDTNLSFLAKELGLADSIITVERQECNVGVPNPGTRFYYIAQLAAALDLSYDYVINGDMSERKNTPSLRELKEKALNILENANTYSDIFKAAFPLLSEEQKNSILSDILEGAETEEVVE